jgi:hypothetical protein
MKLAHAAAFIAIAIFTTWATANEPHAEVEHIADTTSVSHPTSSAPDGGHGAALPNASSNPDEHAVATDVDHKPMAASHEYMILSAFLAGSGTVSGVVLRWMKKKEPAA